MGQGAGRYSERRQRWGVKVLQGLAGLFLLVGLGLMAWPQPLMQGGSDPTGVRIVAAVLVATGAIKLALAALMRRVLA